MSVMKVKIKEFKKLKNLEKELAGHHVLVMGENGVGKSTFIQFIEIALGKSTNIPPGVNGSGELVVDRNGTLITCKVEVRDGKSILKISGRGISIDNKKGAIAELFGALDFDIDEFVDLSKTKAGRKEQVEIFKGFLPQDLQTELATYEANVQNAYNDRTELGKDIKKLEGAIASHPLVNIIPPELVKFQPVDIAGAMAQLTKLREENANREKVSTGIADRRLKTAEKVALVAEYQAKINALNSEIETMTEEIKKGDKWLADHKAHDTSVLEKQITEAGETNLKYSQAQQLLSEIEKLEKAKEAYGEATALVESSREAIANAIREQEGPIEGLTYDDEQLVYKGIPVNPDSLSTSEIMELGIRLKMAENPELGILFIQRAESLGTERFKLIKEIADKAGWQLIAEQVERGNKELHIEIMTDELIEA